MHVARLPFDEGGDVRVLRTGQEIALPVAGDGAVLDAGWPLRDRDRIDDLSTRLARFRRAFATPDGPTCSQMGSQFPLQNPPRACTKRLR